MKRTLLFLSLLALAACGKQEEAKKSGPPPTLITVAQVKSGSFEVTEDTLGTLETVIDPKIGAEVAGRIARVHARAGQTVKAGQVLAGIDSGDVALQHRADEAEARRLELLAERQLALVDKGFLSQTAGENATAQRDVARARADISRRNVGKTQVRAPVDGSIETQNIAEGDYVKVGDPLFLLVSNRRLRAHLPFPESAAPRLKRGQVVRLTSPQLPGRTFEAPIADIRPSVAEGSRALDVIVDLDNADGLLKAGGTVNAAVRIAAKEAALVVPEQSVVLRPAGKVVYAIVEEDGTKKAQQRIVQAGAKKGGVVEILAGIKEGETVAQDGAGFLSHGAAVAIKEPKVGAGDTAKKAPAGKPEGK